MANGRQMKFLIDEAYKRLAEHGYENADLRDVFLAGIGFLSEEIRRPPLSNKKIMAVATTIGTGFGAGLIVGVMKVFGV